MDLVPGKDKISNEEIGKIAKLPIVKESDIGVDSDPMNIFLKSSGLDDKRPIIFNIDECVRNTKTGMLQVLYVVKQDNEIES